MEKEKAQLLPAMAVVGVDLEAPAGCLAVAKRYGEYIGGETRPFTTSFGVTFDLGQSTSRPTNAYVCGLCHRGFICKGAALRWVVYGHFLGRKGNDVKLCSSITRGVLQDLVAAGVQCEEEMAALEVPARPSAAETVSFEEQRTKQGIAHQSLLRGLPEEHQR